MLSIVVIGRRRLLIGSTEHNISLVADLTENVTASNVPREPALEMNLPAPAVKMPANSVKMSPAVVEEDDSASFSTFLKMILSRESTRK
jgi:flagellar biogenesis protein FliO